MKFIFTYLALLNLFDGIVSFIGLKRGVITEANPLMNELYSYHPVLFLALKVSLSLFLYLFIFFNIVPRMSWFKALTLLAATLYTGTFILHGFWLYLAVY